MSVNEPCYKNKDGVHILCSTNVISGILLSLKTVGTWFYPRTKNKNWRGATNFLSTWKAFPARTVKQVTKAKGLQSYFVEWVVSSTYYKACFKPFSRVLLFMPPEILPTRFPQLTSVPPYSRLAVRLWERGSTGRQHTSCPMELWDEWGGHTELLTSSSS